MFRAAKKHNFYNQDVLRRKCKLIIKNQLGIDFHFKLNLLMLTSPEGDVVK